MRGGLKREGLRSGISSHLLGEHAGQDGQRLCSLAARRVGLDEQRADLRVGLGAVGDEAVRQPEGEARLAQPQRAAHHRRAERRLELHPRAAQPPLQPLQPLRRVGTAAQRSQRLARVRVQAQGQGPGQGQG